MDPQTFQRFLDKCQASFKACQTLGDPDRLNGLKDFQQSLQIWCGEDPGVFFSLTRRVQGPDHIGRLSLADDLAVFLQAQHAALYYRKTDGAFELIAAFGKPTGPIQFPGLLIRWLMEHDAPLVCTQLSLQGLSLQEAESLLEEVDALGASVVVPLTTWLDGELKGVLVVGPPLAGEYGQEEILRLCQHGQAIMKALLHRESGRPTYGEIQAEREAMTRKVIDEWWPLFQPNPPLRFLILDELPEVADYLCELFAMRGISAEGYSSQEEALKALDKLRPDVLLVDLSLHQKMPLTLLKSVAAQFPEALLFGITTGWTNTDDSVATELGVRRIFHKPCRIEPMVYEILEAILTHRLREAPTHP